MGSAALLAAVVGCAGAGSSGPQVAATHVDMQAYASQVVEHTNRARGAEGLEDLEVSGCAADVARQRAAALVGQEELTHAAMDEVFAACGPVQLAAENLSRAASDPSDVVGAWMASYGHRANIVDVDLQRVGVGCVPDGERVLCAQVFLGAET
ncbi:CAP domain-containing protein [Cellulomonas bogoriensis]